VGNREEKRKRSMKGKRAKRKERRGSKIRNQQLKKAPGLSQAPVPDMGFPNRPSLYLFPFPFPFLVAFTIRNTSFVVVVLVIIMR
jgi:hypothetical protein